MEQGVRSVYDHQIAHAQERNLSGGLCTMTESCLVRVLGREVSVFDAFFAGVLAECLAAAVLIAASSNWASTTSTRWPS